MENKKDVVIMKGQAVGTTAQVFEHLSKAAAQSSEQLRVSTARLRAAMTNLHTENLRKFSQGFNQMPMRHLTMQDGLRVLVGAWRSGYAVPSLLTRDSLHAAMRPYDPRLTLLSQLVRFHARTV